MNLSKNNFMIKAIIIDFENKITEINMNESIEGFTSSNSAPTLGVNNMKYKFMFSNFKVPDNSKFVIFQVSIFVDNKYYNPYLFLPILNEDKKESVENPGRAISYKLNNNIFQYIWLYFTIDGIKNIVDTFQPSSQMTSCTEYVKEYLVNNVVVN